MNSISNVRFEHRFFPLDFPTIPGVANGATDLADTAIRALEGGALSYNGNPSKSTLIIHSVQRVRIEFPFLLV